MMASKNGALLNRSADEIKEQMEEEACDEAEVLEMHILSSIHKAIILELNYRNQEGCEEALRKVDVDYLAEEIGEIMRQELEEFR